MKKIIFMALILFAGLESMAGELTETISRFVENKPFGTTLKVDNEDLFSSKMLRQFYMNRLYKPAWVRENTFTWINSKLLDNNGYILLDYVRRIDEHGLRPGDYHLDLIEEYIKKQGHLLLRK